MAIALLAGCTTPTQLSFDGGEPDDSDLTSTELVADATQGDTEESDVAPAVASPQADAATNQSFDATAVEQRFASLITDWTKCFHRPGNCDVSRSTAPESPERTRLTDALAYYATEQLRTKPNEGTLEWRIESMSASSNDRIRLVVCEYDTRIFFDASMADTELGDIILDATVWTRRVEWVLARSDDTWRLWSRRIERRSPTEKFCNV
jgi:hypothetical protein